MAENPQIQPDLLASHMPTDIPFAVSHAPTPPPLPSIQMDPDASPHDKLMQGLNQGGVPLVAPDGHPGFVHRDSLNTFLGKNPGYKTGAVVTAPDGHPGIVAHDALNAFLKSNPTYKLGQATPQTDAVLQEPRMNESRTDMLNRTVVEPFRQEMEPKSAWEEIKRDIERGINPLSNPVVQAAGNLVTEGGQKLSDLIAHEWEGVSPDTTIGKFGKNYLAPAAETAATGVLAPMAQPESIATMGAFKAPMAGAAGRLIRAGSGLAFGVPALKAAVKSGAPAVQAAAEGNTPEAVRLGTQAAFNTALAAETLGGAARETPGVVKDAANGSPYWLAKRLPESLLTPQKQVSMDIRRAAGQASNLAAGLETGGSPTGKSVQTYEDIAQPILPDVRAEAAKQGITEKDFEGRKGYKTAPKITAGVRQSYDDAYNGLLDPLRGDYAGEAAKSAAKEVVNKMLGDSALMDEIQKGDPSGRNVQALRNLRDSIANVRTVGQLDDMRQALNRLSGKYEARSEGQQYLSPLTQETLHEGANSIRNALYGEMERLYGGRSTPTEINQGEVQNPAVQAGITEDHIRELQRNHGAAIQADDLMQQTARKLSGESSKAAAPPTYWQRLRGSAAPLEMAGRPQMAATEFFRSILGFKPPDATGVFNTQMKRVIKGATADEGTTFPQGATTPEYVPGRSEGPTSSRVPGLALPAPTPFADAEVVGPRGPAQLGGSGIDQRALPPGSYEQPPSRFTPKPKELPPATLPAEFAPPTNRVEAVGIPQTAEASAVQNRFEQKPAGFTPPKRPFFMKGDVPRMPTGRPLTPEEIAVQQQPGTTGIAPDIGNWQPPPELGVTSAPDYGQKARAEVEAKMGGPLKRQSLDQSKQEVPNGQKVQAQQEGQITPKSQTGGGEQPPSATETVGSAAGAARDTPIMARLEKEHPDWTLSQRLQAAAKEANPGKSQSVPSGPRNPSDVTDRAKLKDLQSIHYKTAGQEQQIEHLKARIAADPSKWKVGDGVGWKVYGNQINRGFRIVDVDPQTKEATIRQVADTGLTTSGGNNDRIGDTSVHVADLVRDNKYKSGVPAVQAAVKSQPAPTVGSPEYEDLKARVAQLEQKKSGKGIVGVLGKKAEVAPEVAPEVPDTKSVAETDRAASLQSEIEDLKVQRKAKMDEILKHGTYDAKAADLRKEHNDLMAQIGQREDEIARLRGEPTRSEKRAAAKTEEEKKFGERPAKAMKYGDLGQSQPWQVKESDYISKRFDQLVGRYEKAIPEQEAEVSKTTATSQKGIQARANLKYWNELLQAYKDHDPRKAQEFRNEYTNLIKEAVSHGKPVPEEVIQQKSEFTLAKDARERYEKGRHTSFANRSVAVNDTMQGESGFKVKRQDGKPITDDQIKEIHNGVKDVEKVFGPMRDVLRGVDLTIAHTSGKQPFLMNSVGGLFSEGDRRITIGIEDMLGRPVRAFAHEFGHMADIKAGDAVGINKTHVWFKGNKRNAAGETASLAESEDRSGESKLFRDATAKINDVREIRTLLKARSAEESANLPEEQKVEVQRAKIQLGPYWREPREVFARLFEQYVANEIGKENFASQSPEYYAKRPGWWTQAEFDKLKPAVKQAIDRRLSILRGKYPTKEPESKGSK